MKSRVRMLAATIAVLLLVAGGAVAAVNATGRSTAHARVGGHLRAGRDLRAASAYLGMSVPELQAKLRAGSSLAQVAQATPGHSVEGITSALLAAKRARLAKASSALPRLVQSEVQRAGGPGVGPFAAATSPRGRLRLGALVDIGLAAASYIGTSARDLRAELAAGKTLGEIAREHGRSEAGLVKTLVQARTHALAEAVSAGAITQAREAKVLARLQARILRLVEHRFG